jgi:ABC-2 type transport system ATP-binding protein
MTSVDTGTTPASAPSGHAAGCTPLGPRLRIRHGPIRRGHRSVLEAAHFEVPLPATIGIVGVNGSGKSSLFMALAGVLPRRRGAAEVSVRSTSAGVAYVPQSPVFPDWLVVEAIARLYATDFSDLQERMPALYLQELAGQRSGALSNGQRQALAIAIALGRAADITLMDEPFAALDFRRRIGALELLQQWRQDHPESAVLLASQASADLAGLCDHFLVLRDGRYAYRGPVGRLAAYDDDVERQLLRLLT